MLFELGTGKPPPVLKKWGGGGNEKETDQALLR